MSRVLPLLVFVCLIAAACGTPLIQGSVGSDFLQARQQAFDALSRRGQVFHAVETVSRDGSYQRTDEVWLDLENDAARVSEGGRLRIFHEGKIAELDNMKRLEDGEIWPSDVEKTSALALSHIVPLFSTEIRSSGVVAPSGEGTSAYRLDVETTWHGDWTGADKFEIYLDEDYLPVRIVDKVEGAGPEDREIDTDVKYDFIPRANLPVGFVSFAAIQSLAVPPTDFLEQAVAKGIRPYWLGESFENMSLTDVALGQPDVVLEYMEEGDGEQGWAPPGVIIQEYIGAPANFCPTLLGAETVRREVSVAGRTATLCQANGANIGLTGDQYLELLIPFDGTNVVVKSSYGAPGDNPYRNVDDMLRLGAALRMFSQ
jgi:hypothetical protein